MRQTALEPGHRILLYTGGVVESRDEGGEEFGLERFTEYVTTSTTNSATTRPSCWSSGSRPAAAARAVTVLGPSGQVEMLDGLAGAAALDRPGVDDPQC
uniref:SpoIIE family protein phosphatase n=1 Tax=Streptomyces cynarae TaxID=2981134 RepID=UPI0036F3D9D9